MISSNFVRFAALACTAALASQSQTALPAGVTRVTSIEGITEYRLANGLRVLLVPDPTKTNITVNITYMVGSRHEDYGETGMAHLLEHLLFKGSKNHPNVPKELGDHGSRPNGTTSFDRTNYFETFTATDENLEWALSLEADRMVNSFIAKKDLDSEMTVVRNEYEMGENSPQRILMERVMSTAFLWHNYGKSTIGAKSDLEQVPIERLQAFYRHFYQPDNAVLVVAGKIEEAKTLGLVTKHFAGIPKPSRPLRRTYTVEPVQDGERTVTLRRVGDTQVAIVGYHAPPSSHEEFVALDLAVSMFGDQPGGRLYKALVEGKKAASANMFSRQARDAGYVMASATVRVGTDLAEANRVLIDTVESIAKQPFTAEEFERIRGRELKDFELSLNDPETLAFYLSEWQAMGDWRLMFIYRDRVKAATLAQAQKAAEKYLIASNRTNGLFMPDKAPVRVEPPAVPDIEAIVKDYKGGQLISQGEAFDASNENIDKKTVRGQIGDGLKLAFLSKKTRGNQVVATLQLHFGDEMSLKSKQTAASVAGAMLMRGTAKRTRQQISDEIDRLKARVMITGNLTGATARITATRENLGATLDLVAELLKESTFPQDEFDRLKTQRLAQLEAMKNEPQAIAMTALQSHLTPYPAGDVRAIMSTEEQIEGLKAITLDEVKKFHQSFYGASKAELSVIGDFDAEATQSQARKLFGTWKSASGYKDVIRAYKAAPQQTKVIETPDKANAMWVTGVPVQLKDTDADYPALLFGNYILGASGINSRLFHRIRGKDGLSYGAGSMLSAGVKGDGAIFMAYAIANPTNTPKVEAAFEDELRKILDKGYTQEEVDAAKKAWMQEQMVERANDDELVGSIARNLFYDRTLAFQADIEKKIQALTPEQIRLAMKKYIDPAKLSIVRAGDFKKANVLW